jgi:asparagine synthetase B (glutamine-hydrolysing)
VLVAARRQTRQHARVGVALSTGLDSVVALTAAPRRAGGRGPEKKLRLFAVRFGPDDQDLGARAVLARRFGTTYHEVHVEPADLPGMMAAALRAMEGPIGGEELVFFHAVAREAAKHVALLLTRQQSDNLFGGMPHHRRLSLAARLPVARGSLMELPRWTQAGLPPRSLAGWALVAGCAGDRRLPPPDVIGAAAKPVRPSGRHGP